MTGPLSAERLAAEVEARWTARDRPGGTIARDEILGLLAEVHRLSEENGRLRERIEAALEIDSKPMVGFLADLDFAAGIADGFNDCRSKFRSVLVPREAGKK